MPLTHWSSYCFMMPNKVFKRVQVGSFPLNVLIPTKILGKLNALSLLSSLLETGKDVLNPCVAMPLC